MINTHVKKNKFGGYTHEIKIDSIFFLRLIEMDPNSINIELVEKRIVKRDKVHFSIINHESLVQAVIMGFAEVIYPVKHKQSIDFNIDFIQKLSDNVLYFLNDHEENLRKRSIVKFRTQSPPRSYKSVY